MSITLAKPLSLITSGRYADPIDDGTVIPDVYGDFSAGGRTGPIRAVMIDSVNRVYAAAAHAVTSIDEVWVGDVLKVLTTDYTVSLSNNYEAQGVIATITFTVAHGLPTAEVTWRGKGKQVGGALEENPIAQLRDLLTTRSTWVAADFDAAAYNIAVSDAAAQGYETAWVVDDGRFVEEWVKEILFNALATIRISSRGLAEIFVDRGRWIQRAELVASLVAARDCVGGDDGVSMRGDIIGVVNALNVDYLWHWALGQRSSRLTSPQDDISVNAHGEMRKTVTLRGHRTQAQVETWATALFDRAALRRRVEGAILDLAVDGPMLMHAGIWDPFSLTWAWGPRREHGNQYRNQILRVLSVEHDTAGAGVTRVRAIDTGLYVLSEEFYDALVLFDADKFFGGGRELGVVA